MIKYIIYLAMAVLIIWSVFYVVKTIHRQWSTKRGCGSCEGCRLDCPSRRKKE